MAVRSNVGELHESYRLYEDPVYEPDDVVKENAVEYLADDIMARPDNDIEDAFA